MDICVEHLLAGFVAAQRGDGEQHRDDPEIDGGDAPKRVLAVSDRVARFMDFLADFVRLDHVSSSTKFEAADGFVTARVCKNAGDASSWAWDSARPATAKTLACATCQPRGRYRAGRQFRQNRESGAETGANGH